MAREVALKIVTLTTLFIGLISLAVIATKKQLKDNNPCEFYSVSVVEEEKINNLIEDDLKLDDNNYFVIIFAYDSKGIVRKPIKSHVFALFYETNKSSLKKDLGISWCQFGGQFKPGISKGKNYSIKETLEYASKNDLEVQMWGPYAIDEKFYKNAILRHKDLESGKYSYRTWDAPNRIDPNYPAINNIHAVSDIAGCIETEGKYGKDAAKKIIEKFQINSVFDLNKNYDNCYDQIMKKLGLYIQPVNTRS